MPDIPYNEPSTLRMGDTITWKKTSTDYPPADGWTLKYAFRNATVKKDVTCTTSGTDYLATILPAASAAYSVGRYDWIAYVTKGAGPTLEQHTIDQGSIQVLPNLSADALYDARTDARIIYDSLITAYKSYVSSNGTMSSFSIAGKSVAFTSAADIIKQMQYWYAKVSAEEDAEKIANGQGTGKKILYQF